MEYAITDLGQSFTTDVDMVDYQGNTTREIKRYAAWKIVGNVMDEVVESSNDVEYLKDKYNTETVYELGRVKNGN
jgi:hypothetical protein